MRMYVRDLTACHIEGNCALLQGTGGSRRLSFFEGTVLRFEYAFEGVAPNSRALAASRVMTKGEEELLNPIPVRLTETVEAYMPETAEAVSVRADRAYAVPFVCYKGKLQHGGFMGDGDTVIPSYPARQGSPARADSHCGCPEAWLSMGTAYKTRRLTRTNSAKGKCGTMTSKADCTRTVSTRRTA